MNLNVENTVKESETKPPPMFCGLSFGSFSCHLADEPINRQTNWRTIIISEQNNNMF